MRKTTSSILFSYAVFPVAALFSACASNHAVVGSDGIDPSAEVSVEHRDYFRPGALLFDNNGRLVNAHGAGFLYDNGRYYMFGEHKLGGKLGNKSVVGVHCYSSSDLYNWRDEGIAMKMSRDPKSEIFIGTVVERPKVLFNPATKKYVMFFHLERRAGETRFDPTISVIAKEKPVYKTVRVAFAVSDNVCGPYEFVRSARLHPQTFPVNADKKFKEFVGANKDKDLSHIVSMGNHFSSGNADLFFAKCFKEGQDSADFNVFVDDDGKAYMFSTSEGNATLYISELVPDWLGFTGKYSRQMVGEYHEAPAPFKKDGRYYMFSSSCTGWWPNAGRISAADSLFGEWRQIDNPCRGDGQRETAFNLKGDAGNTFRSQSTYVIKVAGKDDALIYWGDRWNAFDAADGRYVMLPIEWEGKTPVIRWHDTWDLSFFDKK